MLYIVSHEKYREILDKGIYKYLSKIYRPSFRAKELGIIEDSKGKLGKVVGINLRAIDYTDAGNIERFIDTINLLGEESYNYLYIEEIDSIPCEVIKKIELETQKTIPTGLDVKLNNLLAVLKDIEKISAKDFANREVLILCKDKELALKLITDLGLMFNFISLVGVNEEHEKEIYEIALKNKGISIIQPKLEQLNINSYQIIINLFEGWEIHDIGLKSSTVIFDFSQSQGFKSRKKLKVIRDFYFKLDNLDIISNKLLDKYIPSSLCEALNYENGEGVHKLLIGNKYYSIKDYVKTSINRELKDSF